MAGAALAAEVDGVTVADWPDEPVAEPGATESGATTVVAVAAAAAGGVVVEGHRATEVSVLESERPAWTTDEGPAQLTSTSSVQPRRRVPTLATFRRLHLVNDLNEVPS